MHLLGQGSPDFLLELTPSSDRAEVVGKDALVMGGVGPLLSGLQSAAAPLHQRKLFIELFFSYSFTYLFSSVCIT